MTYEEYISYHKRGDAGVEERMIASLAYSLKLNQWDSFRLIYFYTMTYHIPSALTMLLEGQRDMKQLHFRTDRRYVRCNGAYDRMLKELNRECSPLYWPSRQPQMRTASFPRGISLGDMLLSSSSKFT